MEFFKEKIWHFLSFVQLKLFGKDSLEKSNLTIECWGLIEILEAYESEIAIKLIPKESHRNLFKIVFFYGCLKALVERKPFDSKKGITEEVFWNSVAIHRNPSKQPFGLTSEQHMRFYNYWMREITYGDEGSWEYKGMPDLINAGKTAIDDCYVIHDSYVINKRRVLDYHLYLKELLTPFKTLFHDKKFIKSARISTTLDRHDLYMDSKIENNKIEVRPK